MPDHVAGELYTSGKLTRIGFSATREYNSQDTPVLMA